MSDGSQSPFSRFGRAQKNQTVEIDLLLNLSRSIVFVVDARNYAILQTNTMASDLTGYTSSELAGLKLTELFPNWNSHLLADVNSQPNDNKLSTILMRRKDFSTAPVSIKHWRTSSDGKRQFLVVDPAVEQLESLYATEPNQTWLTIGKLFAILMEESVETDFVSALSQVITVAQTITGADSLAVYMVDTKQHRLECIVRQGDVGWLPDQLPSQELIQLKSPTVGQPRKRSSSLIHQAAQGRQLNYIASCPLGNNLEINGLVVLAGKNPMPKEGLQQITKIIAMVINLMNRRSGSERVIEETLYRLHQVQNLLRIIQESMLLGCLILSPDLKIIDINHAAENILGYKLNIILGQHVERILIGTETLQAAITELHDHAGALNTTEMRLYRRSGEAFLGQIRSSPVMVDGKLDYIVIFLQDLTEQEYIREQTTQLEQRAILGEVTAVFAHEVRNPINNISTGLELISLNLQSEDPNQPTIARLLQDCDRLAELMKSVLAFSRPAEYTLTQLSLEPFFQNLFERMRPRMERFGVHGSLQIEANCPSILGSPRALEQVFSNLINNALQAMSETGGELVIRIQPAQGTNLPIQQSNTKYLEVSVIDNGPGIPPELVERIFQPFFTTSSGGTGLGLAISKRIITAHRGNITVTSFPGGTVFRVLLPSSDAALYSAKV